MAAPRVSGLSAQADRPSQKILAAQRGRFSASHDRLVAGVLDGPATERTRRIRMLDSRRSDQATPLGAAGGRLMLVLVVLGLVAVVAATGEYLVGFSARVWLANGGWLMSSWSRSLALGPPGAAARPGSLTAAPAAGVLPRVGWLPAACQAPESCASSTASSSSTSPKASTTSGSNWVPAQRRSSWSAAAPSMARW
jgi:hypothetical protein